MDKKTTDLKIRKNTMLNMKKLTYLTQATKELIKNNVNGDIVECGVWMGGSAALIAKVLLENKQKRVLHLLDSFDDPHEPLPVDGSFLIKELGGVSRAKGRLQPIKGYYKKVTRGKGPGDPKVVRNLLVKHVGYPNNKVKIYEGWFQNTIVPFSKLVDKIAFLIIDCDLYEPTKLCLNYLYPKLVQNGIVFVDDYPTLDGCKMAVDEYRVKNNITVPFIRVPRAGCVAWKCEKR